MRCAYFSKLGLVGFDLIVQIEKRELARRHSRAGPLRQFRAGNTRRTGCANFVPQRLDVPCTFLPKFAWVRTATIQNSSSQNAKTLLWSHRSKGCRKHPAEIDLALIGHP